MEINFDFLSDREKVIVVSVLMSFRDSIKNDVENASEKIEDSENVLNDINLVLKKIIVVEDKEDEM